MRDPGLQDDDQEEQGSRPPQPKMRSLIGWGLVLLLTIFLVYELSIMFAGEKEFSREQLHEILANPGSVKNIWIRGQVLYGELASPEYANRYGATKFKVTLNEREVSDYIG